MNNDFKDKAHLIDKNVRMNIKKIQLSASTMKFYYGCNHYGERKKIINPGNSTDECPMCSETKTWDHVVQCRKIVSVRAEFMLEFHEDLK